MGSKLSQYDYSILTLKCVNLIQEKTPNYNNYNNYSENGHHLSVTEGSILYIFKYKYIKIEFHVQPFRAAE